ncbi:MAG: lysophospholipase [Myxococcaceae bacterium]|nr:lysophospholipase [Myxococcaceae bacterium]
MVATSRFERFVALGDSTTEGLDDSDGAGGFRGWANRLAEKLAAAQGSLLYANLGVRGRGAQEIRRDQLEPAVAMRPDLATVVAGMNDLLRWDFDAAGVAGAVGEMQHALVECGAVVVSFTIPDASRRMPIRGGLSKRTAALNEALRRVSAQSGAVLLDLAAHELAADPRLWSVDRLHANSDGHARIADAIAHLLGLPGADDRWMQSLPPAKEGVIERIAVDVHWARHYVFPWLWRRIRGHSAGDRVGAKRPELTPWSP